MDPEILPEAGDATAETVASAKDTAQQADALTEQARIIAAKEAEKAKADLLKTPLPFLGPTDTRIQQDPLKPKYRTRRSSQKQRIRQPEVTPQKEK